jgi:hypothetical protein
MWTKSYIEKAAADYSENHPDVDISAAFLAGANFILDNTQKEPIVDVTKYI